MITVDIVDMTSEGEGLGKLDGFPFFVKDTVIGDQALVRIVKLKRITVMEDWKKSSGPPPAAESQNAVFINPAEAVRSRP